MERIYKYNFLYKITNTINGKIYYGRHSTNKLHDRYLGSGSVIELAKKKYGKKAFTIEILEYFLTRDLVIEAERVLITKDVVADDNTYNIRLGGGADYIPVNSPELCNRISNTLKRKFASGEIINPWKGKKHTAESLALMSESRRGWKWIHNGAKSKLIKQDEAVPMGFILGRLSDWRPTDNDTTRAHLEKLRQDKIGKPKSAEMCAKISKTKSDRRWITNGTNSMLVDPCVEYCMPEGYRFGRGSLKNHADQDVLNIIQKALQKQELDICMV